LPAHGRGKGKDSLKKFACLGSEGAAEGRGLGEEFRRARAIKIQKSASGFSLKYVRISSKARSIVGSRKNSSSFSASPLRGSALKLPKFTIFAFGEKIYKI